MNDDECKHPRTEWEVELDPDWDIMEVRCGASINGWMNPATRRPFKRRCGELLLVVKVPRDEARELRESADQKAYYTRRGLTPPVR